MRIIVLNSLEAKIRAALTKKCPDKSLGNKEDFDVVMTAIKAEIDAWMKNRCAGCK